MRKRIASFAAGLLLFMDWRIPIGRSQHEIQAFARGQFVVGDYGHEALFGLRFLFDI